MTYRSLLFAAVVICTASACGGEDAARPEPTGSATVSAPDTAPATSPDTTSPAPDTSPAPTTPTTDAVETTAAGGGTAECMNGSWVADAAEHQRRVDALGVPIAMIVGPESRADLSIDGGAFVVESAISLTASVGPATLTASSTSRMEGTFTVEGDFIAAADVTVDVTEQGPFVATLADGTAIPMPMDGVEPPSMSPTFTGSTVSCDDTSLTFDVVGTDFGTITYTRVA